ncbi:MAG: hypothetical protein BZY87_09715 [SAR202 cluster bacterium Io17-Chloro-G6]|nr:MAG: hypothetical protein BZY87_09715 [SAR202 cluster bacterium Io17-Chloro-G6]
MPKNPETRAKKPKRNKKSSFDRIVYQIEESGAGTDYQAVCPELVITGFGDTADEAKNSLRRLVAEYLQDCEELEVLDETLIQAGFYFNGELWMSNEVEPAQEPNIRFIGRPPENSSE